MFKKKQKSIIETISVILSVYAISAFAQTTSGGAVSSTVITSGLSDTFTTIWGVAKWIMQAILVITAAIVAFKTATKGQGEDRTGGWIGVIAIILIAIGLNFVPTIADTLFGIKFG
ncbi:MAG: hypothetical protein WBM07_12345 [Chitinivibrionales bacterium]